LTGPDIIGLRENWVHIYKDALIDVSGVCEEFKQRYGAYYPGLEAYSKVDGFEVNGSYIGGVSEKHDAAAPWDKFPPVTKVFKELVFQGFGPRVRTIGYAGPPDQKAGLAWSKYIIVDMFARAVQGDSPASAVAWAETELKSVYEG
jgi:hypothetical protein